MKKRIPTFLAGMITMALISSIGITALAASGAFTISVNQINIQVNGATFQPKDAQGNVVPVFAYNGTTYAPLRALAEAYGLTVGYDAGQNMATVTSGGGVVAPVTPTPTSTPQPTPAIDPNHIPDITAEDLKAWFKFQQQGTWSGVDVFYWEYCGDKSYDELTSFWVSLDPNDIKVAITDWVIEYYENEYSGGKPIKFELSTKDNYNSDWQIAVITYDAINGARKFFVIPAS